MGKPWVNLEHTTIEIKRAQKKNDFHPVTCIGKATTHTPPHRP